jgi:hypothetical protein
VKEGFDLLQRNQIKKGVAGQAGENQPQQIQQQGVSPSQRQLQVGPMPQVRSPQQPRDIRLSNEDVQNILSIVRNIINSPDSIFGESSLRNNPSLMTTYNNLLTQSGINIPRIPDISRIAQLIRDPDTVSQVQKIFEQVNSALGNTPPVLADMLRRIYSLSQETDKATTPSEIEQIRERINQILVNMKQQTKWYENGMKLLREHPEVLSERIVNIMRNMPDNTNRQILMAAGIAASQFLDALKSRQPGYTTFDKEEQSSALGEAVRNAFYDYVGGSNPNLIGTVEQIARRLIQAETTPQAQQPQREQQAIPEQAQVAQTPEQRARQQQVPSGIMTYNDLLRKPRVKISEIPDIPLLDEVIGDRATAIQTQNVFKQVYSFLGYTPPVVADALKRMYGLYEAADNVSTPYQAERLRRSVNRMPVIMEGYAKIYRWGLELLGRHPEVLREVAGNEMRDAADNTDRQIALAAGIAADSFLRTLRNYERNNVVFDKKKQDEKLRENVRRAFYEYAGGSDPTLIVKVEQLAKRLIEAEINSQEQQSTPEQAQVAQAPEQRARQQQTPSR